MICGLCGNKIKKKTPRKKDDVCDKCWKLYIKQNRQMEIETAIYRGGRDA